MYNDVYGDEVTPKNDANSVIQSIDDERRGPEAPRPDRAIIYGQGGLDYLADLVDDDVRDYFLDQIEDACIDDITKQKLTRLVRTYTSKDYAVTNYYDSLQLLKRYYEFRQDLAIIKIFTPGINYTYGDFNNLVGLLESHFNNKVTRSLRGFERINQITQNVNSSYMEKLERKLSETKSGLSAIIHGKN
jgi:hypothetical protein